MVFVSHYFSILMICTYFHGQEIIKNSLKYGISSVCTSSFTVKTLKIGTPEIITIIVL